MSRVLVVDDDPDMRDLISLVLSRAGHDVVAIGDPLTAVVTAAAERVDVAVLDWSMPGKNGGEVCADIRADPDLGCLPVLVVTAHGDPVTRARAAAAGASRFMSKPFTLGELTSAVAALLVAGPRLTAGDGAP